MSISENRKTYAGYAFLNGLIAGVVVFFLAESSGPGSAISQNQHDLVLANRLGLIYPPIVGLWLGWLQKSGKRALWGAVAGIVVGWVSTWPCISKYLLSDIVNLPCLLAAMLSAMVGSNRSPWFSGLGGRLSKGLFAGFALLYVCIILFALSFAIFMPAVFRGRVDIHEYIHMMWRCGPIALGLSSALFFALIRWAVGLPRVRLLVFENVDAPKSDQTI